jgi:VIT1/CCC1 family predicted Fe2+/Mn2+ transporter
VARNPRLVLDEVAARLEEAGMGRATARQASTELPLDEDRFFSFTSRTVFGLNPDELGSPMTAAVSSLLLFAVGALLPLLPWFFTEGVAATVLSVVLTAAAGLVVGGAIARSSGRTPLRGALRQLAIVVVASAVTYGVGALFGTTVA